MYHCYSVLFVLIVWLFILSSILKIMNCARIHTNNLPQVMATEKDEKKAEDKDKHRKKSRDRHDKDRKTSKEKEKKEREKKKDSKEVSTRDRGSTKNLPPAKVVPSSSSYEEEEEEESLEQDTPVRPEAPAGPDLRKPAEPKGLPKTAAKTKAAEVEVFRCEHCGQCFNNKSGYEQHGQWSKRCLAMQCYAAQKTKNWAQAQEVAGKLWKQRQDKWSKDHGDEPRSSKAQGSKPDLLPRWAKLGQKSAKASKRAGRESAAAAPAKRKGLRAGQRKAFKAGKGRGPKRERKRREASSSPSPDPRPPRKHRRRSTSSSPEPDRRHRGRRTIIVNVR